jgi:enamine deaminase RidA (YjgF/YER057c/UK114 family)
MKTVGLGVALSLSLTGPAFAQIEREYVNPWEKEIGYAQVVRHGDTLYLSGITASGASVAEQMTAIYGQIGKILKSRGLDSTAILSETIYTRDIEAVKAAIPVRKSFYKDGQYPASTWVQVERLFNPDLLLEIEVTVALKP